MYENKCSYSTINTAKSAIICINNITDNTNTKHNHIARFMKGVFNMRPPHPKHTKTWDINTVLNFLKTWSPNSTLSLKKLTLKTVCLVALISAQRAQSIEFMDIEYMTKNNDNFTFTMNTVIKQMKPGRKCSTIVIPKYEDPDLCVYRLIELYIENTKQIRQSTKFWIGFNKPHKSISRQTISRWLKQSCVLLELIQKCSRHTQQEWHSHQKQNSVE